MNIDIKVLRKLSRADKLEPVELLWDDIAASDEPFNLHPMYAE